MERSDVGLAAGDVERQARVAHDLLARLGGVVLGQEAVLRDALAALIARGHVLLEGVPGTAKTLLVRSLSLALGWSSAGSSSRPTSCPRTSPA